MNLMIIKGCENMNTREKCNLLLDRFSDSELKTIVSFLEKIDEKADMEFCLALAKAAENDPDSGDVMSIEEFAQQLGIPLP